MLHTQQSKNQHLDSSKLNSWLMQNIQIMQELTIIEPANWREVDTPGWFNKRELPDSIMIVYCIITYSCNYHCGFCIRKNIPHESMFMDYEKFLDVLDILDQIGVDGFVVTGGEPFSHPQWICIQYLSFWSQVSEK